MLLRPGFLAILVLVAAFVSPSASAYSRASLINFNNGTHILNGYSETWKDYNDADYYYDCVSWTYDDTYTPQCTIIQEQDNYAAVYADLYSPGGFYNTYYASNFSHATASYSGISVTSDSGFWTGVGRHYALAVVYQYYCYYNFCGGPIYVGTYSFSAGSNTQVKTSILSWTASRYTTTPLTDTDLDSTILPDSKEILSTNDGLGDVACVVAIQRYGSVSTFSIGDGTIDSTPELNAVLAASGRIHAVNTINWCDDAPPPSGYTFRGCSNKNAAGIVVIRTTLEGNLWAHEYGHNEGLGDTTDSGFLMNGVSNASNRRVHQSECDAIRNAVH